MKNLQELKEDIKVVIQKLNGSFYREQYIQELILHGDTLVKASATIDELIELYAKYDNITSNHMALLEKYQNLLGEHLDLLGTHTD